MGEACVPVTEDEVLVARAVAGDVTAFTGLVERYKGRVYALAYRRLGDADVAEEAAQETFVRAYVHLTKYRRGSNFASWLLAIAAHWCIDYQRVQGRRARRAMPLGAASEQLPDTTATGNPEAVALANEQRHSLVRWVEALPTAYHQVVVLHYFRGLSYSEISSRLGQPITTVKIRLHRARQHLARSGHPE